MQDTAGTWKKHAAEVKNVPVNKHNNSRQIVDDILIWAENHGLALDFLCSQLVTFQAQRLSLNLGKSSFFPN